MAFWWTGWGLCLCLSTESAIWWIDRCCACVFPRNSPFGGCAGVVPVFVHGIGHLVDGPVFMPVFIQGIGHLVDGPVFMPVFIHGNGFLVDKPVFVPMFVHGIGHLVDG